MRIGLHTSIAGSVDNAALEAIELGANTFQIFTSSPRQWKASVPSQPAIERLRKLREKHDLYPLVIHDNYLINLAAADPAIRAKSVEAFRGELVRGLAVGAEYLVAHPGNYKGMSVEQGILAVIEGIAQAASGLNTSSIMMLIENTAGAGAQLGGRLEELHVMREYAKQQTDLRIGFCLDTCHLLASGYDVSSADGLSATMSEVERLLGAENVPVIHANDSKGGLGSHLDRHQNIGEGYIGLEGFQRILTHPLLRDKAFILETPSDDGNDKRNLETLKTLWRNKTNTVTTTIK